jgi:hypothetical protein
MSNLFSLDDLELTETTTPIVESDVLSRLVFLIESMKIELPNWLKYKLQFADQLSKPLVLWSPLWKTLHRTGSIYGDGNLEEFKQCLAKFVMNELKSYEDNSKFWQYLSTLADGLFNENDVTDFKDIEDEGEIDYFLSGFEPFDNVMGKATGKGFYQGIMTVAATPGSGKTTLLLSFLGELAKSYPVWYFQTEIPAKLSKSRISLVKPKNVVDGCKIFHGNYSSDSILELVEKDPNPDRIILYDSPEIKTSGSEPITYFERVYQDLVAIKQQSRLVVVTSQTKQNVGWEDLGIYSLSDSAAKARYTDIILYLSRIYDTVLVKTAKNRFGPLGQTMLKYNYATLKITKDFVDDMFIGG